MLGWNLNPRTPCSEISLLASRAPAFPFQGSMLANGISTSGCAAATSAISSFDTGTSPVPASLSTPKTTAAMFRSR